AAGFAALGAHWGERLAWADLAAIIVTHGHIDHYGGLTYVRTQTAAPLAVHALDQPVVEDPQTATTAQARAAEDFLRAAGVDTGLIEALMRRYRASGRDLTGWAVTTVLQDGAVFDGRFAVTHTPGHCAGQV